MLTFPTSLDKTTTTDPETGEETTTYSTNTALVHLYGPTGNGTEITTGVLKDGSPDGIGTFLLTDIRDNKTYTTRRLADGSCWMVQNLALDLSEAASGRIAINNQNSDLNSIEQWVPDSATISTFSVDSIASFSSHELDVITGYKTWYTDSEIVDTHRSQYTGNHYDWLAAVAEIPPVATSFFTYDSICPYGWQLPTTNKRPRSYYTLINDTYALTSDQDSAMAILQFPLSFSYTGYTRAADNSLMNDIYGRYWTNVSAGSSDSYRLSFSDSELAGEQTLASVNGIAIRCVAHGNEIQSQESQEAVATTCSAGKICYDGNGGTGSMADQSAAAGSSVVLTAPTYTRLGYSFAGWSTQDNGFGTVYGPNETITVPSQATLGSGNGYQLYAKWLPSTGTMQDFTTAQCNALGEHQSIALTDNRDGNVYTVTKLKDGNCWMTTNLALNLADFAGDNPKSGYLTTENTDIGNDKDGNGNPTRTDLIDLPSTGGGNSGVRRWDPSKSMRDRAEWIIYNYPQLFVEEGDPVPSTAAEKEALVAQITGATDYNYFEIVSENLLGMRQTAQFQSEDQIGEGWSWDSYCEGVGNCNTGNRDRSLTAMPRSYIVNSIHGGYYNYYAATAGDGLYGAETSGLANTPNDSICPKGWVTPAKQGISMRWSSLFAAYPEITNGIRSTLLPLAFTLSGVYSSATSSSAQESNIYIGNELYNYFGSYTSSENFHVRLTGYGSAIHPTNGSSKTNGNSVRCVFVMGS